MKSAQKVYTICKLTVNEVFFGFPGIALVERCISMVNPMELFYLPIIYQQDRD
jgi:hypothetical protein